MGITENVGAAFGLTIIAGLATGIGSAITYFIRKPKAIYLSFFLGLSAGVMIYVSFMELLPHGLQVGGQKMGLLFFFAGIGFIGLIDVLVPKAENPHHYEILEDMEVPLGDKSIMRMGVLTAGAIAIHNFPEGLATFASAMSDIKVGIFICAAIAIHNIPEGIAVSVPIYYATGSRKKAFFYSFFSGCSEPLGAVIGYLVLWPFFSERVLALLLAFVAGTMIYISLDELLPTAHRYGQSHFVIGGVVLGMLIMALSLAML